MIQELTTGIRMAYTELGDPSAEPLVLVAGAGSSKYGWWPLADMLAERYRLISFDCRGLGESAAGAEPVTMETMADDIAALLDALGIAQTHLLGWSFGSAVAQAFALRHPDRLGALVLWSTWARTGGYLQAVFTSLRYPFVHRDAATAATVLALVFSPDMLDSPMGELILTQLLPLFPQTEQQMRTTVEQWDAALAHDVVDRLPLITGPTLVVAGDQDMLCPPRYSQAVAELIPQARYRMFSGPGASHAVGFERAEEFAALVFDFLAEHGLAGPVTGQSCRFASA